MSGFTYDDAGKRVAFIATSLTKPTELYVADVDGKNERRLTSFRVSERQRPEGSP